MIYSGCRCIVVPNVWNICARLSNLEARSIDRSIDKPRPREENNSPLGERNFASMFSFPVTRPTRLRFPRFPTCTLFLFFARLLLPQEREETLGRWELKLKNRSPRRPLWTRSTWTTLFSFFCYTLLGISMAFILDNSAYFR